MSNAQRLRDMLLGKVKTSTDGRAPLFPRERRVALLEMLRDHGDDPRTLARVEGAIWAESNYNFLDMEAE